MDGVQNPINKGFQAPAIKKTGLTWIEQLNPLNHINATDDEDAEQQAKREQAEADQHERFTAKLLDVLVKKGLFKDKNNESGDASSAKRFDFKFNPKSKQLEIWHRESKQLVLAISDEDLRNLLKHLDEPLPPGILTSARG